MLPSGPGQVPPAKVVHPSPPRGAPPPLAPWGGGHSPLRGGWWARAGANGYLTLRSRVLPAARGHYYILSANLKNNQGRGARARSNIARERVFTARAIFLNLSPKSSNTILPPSVMKSGAAFNIARLKLTR